MSLVKVMVTPGHAFNKDTSIRIEMSIQKSVSISARISIIIGISTSTSTSTTPWTSAPIGRPNLVLGRPISGRLAVLNGRWTASVLELFL